jgi:hypothetical protein
MPVSLMDQQLRSADEVADNLLDLPRRINEACVVLGKLATRLTVGASFRCLITDGPPLTFRERRA